jgi:glycosyltransferase involved in cell wall biosynthesis
MKIAIASLGNPKSGKTWSGTPKSIFFALSKNGHEVCGINLLKPLEPWYYNWLRRIYIRMFKKWFLSSVEPKILKQIGKQLDEKVNKINPDVVLVIHGDFLSHTTFKQPSIIIHDTTFASILNYYSDFSNLSKRSIKNGNKMYKLSLDKATAAVFPSKWASESAIVDYTISAEKIFTIPFGANLNRTPNRNEVEMWIENRISNVSQLFFLFIGVDWKRKGGNDALEFIKELNKFGIPSKLIVVGCKPITTIDEQKFIEEKGYLNKNNPEENSILEELMISCHALLLPSLAECFGCVYCEANAYGLPVIGRNTGGVSEIIKEGVNGLMLNKEEFPSDLAIKFLSLIQDIEQYKNISINARNEYERHLNYETFVLGIENIIKKNNL